MIALIIAVRAAMRASASADNYTPFSGWYKGEHKKVRAALIKTVVALVKGSKAEPALHAAAKSYLDGLRSRAEYAGDFLEACRTYPVAVFPNAEDGVEARVFDLGSKGFSVALVDTDAAETLDVFRFFPLRADAETYAAKIAAGVAS